MSWVPSLLALVAAAVAGPGPDGLGEARPIAAVDAVYLPDMTWMEVRDARDAGATTVLVPTGGIEQNGPFLVLGKHDRIAREVAERAARELGDALVAPVIPFVPEGDIDPASDHMRYPGTISARPATFRALLEDTVESLSTHGFEHVVLIGDSWGNQGIQADVAARLDGRRTRVHHIDAFYDPVGANAFLEDRGLAWTDDAYHDDPGFTLQLLAIDPVAARLEQRREAGLMVTDGFDLSPTDDLVALGDALLDWRADRTAAAIREARVSPAPSWTDGPRAVALAPVRAIVDPAERIGWPYLLSALVLAAAVEAWRLRTVAPGALARALFPREVWLSRDALHDLLFCLFGGVFAFTWFGGAWDGLVEGARLGTRAALGSTGIETLGLAPGWGLVAATTVATAGVVDLAVYLAHLAQHRIPVLWAFHRVHHAAERLTPMTLFRQHPVDLLLGGALCSVFSGGLLAVLDWVSPEAGTGFEIAGLNAILFGFYLAGYNLRHSHVWWSWGPLDRLLVSPAMHQIHHSDAPEHRDRNLGLTFSIWDQLFGTAFIPERREALRFGIGAEGARIRTFVDFWLAPFYPSRRE